VRSGTALDALVAMRLHLLALLAIGQLACIPPPGGADAGPDDGGGADTDAGAAADDDAGPGACPLSADARAVLDEAMNSYVRDLGLIGAHMSATESAYAISPIGSTSGNAGFAFLIAPCTGPSEFDPYCSSISGAGGDDEDQLCLRLSCEADGILVSNAWLATPDHTAAGDAHVFTAATDVVPGIATYDPNPLIAWRADARNPDNVAVTAALDWTVVLVTDAGETIDLAHTGDLSARRVGDDGVLTGAIHLVFPRIIDGKQLNLDLTIASSGDVTGEVKTSDELLGTLGGHFDDETGTTIAWAAGCG
jgi:hypothetical protein